MSNQHSKCDDCYKSHLPEVHDRTILPSEAFSEGYVPEFNQASEDELDEILREMRYRTLEDNGLTVNGLKTIEQETKQAILAWHNKQVEEVLDRLITSGDSEGRIWVETIKSVLGKLKEVK